jgi:hypothetical protein
MSSACVTADVIGLRPAYVTINVIGLRPAYVTANVIGLRHAYVTANVIVLRLPSCVLRPTVLQSCILHFAHFGCASCAVVSCSLSCCILTYYRLVIREI